MKKGMKTFVFSILQNSVQLLCFHYSCKHGSHLCKLPCAVKIKQRAASDATCGKDKCNEQFDYVVSTFPE